MRQSLTDWMKENRKMAAVYITSIVIGFGFGPIAYYGADASVIASAFHSLFGLTMCILGVTTLHQMYEHSQPVESDSYVREEVTGSELSQIRNEYPACGEYILTRFEHVKSPEFSKDVKLGIDIPGHTEEFRYDYPYLWDTDEGISQLADERGLEESELHKLEGMPVLVKTTENSQSSMSKYNVLPPEEKIEKMWKNEDINAENVNIEGIRENFDTSLPEGLVDEADTGSDNCNDDSKSADIEVEDSGLYSIVESVR